MEYVFNNMSCGNDTAGVPDRRLRPQSAFVPSQSYYKQRVGPDDDVGRPVQQHKPLAKGEHTQLTLAKVFEDDPGMRPKVFAPPSVNKVSYGLLSRDIDGATPHVKTPPNKARDTNPMAPLYVLPGSSTIPVPQPPPEPAPVTAPTAAAAAAAAAADAAAGRPPKPVQRNTLDVADINAVTSVSERPHKMGTRGTQLSTADIEGSWPGWEPHFRAHVGQNLRDPGLDVRDISAPSPSCRRRAFSARPTVGSSRGGGGAGGWGGGGSHPPAAAAHSHSHPHPHLHPHPQQQQQQQPGQGQGQQPQQRQTYLPPPVAWKPMYDTDTGADQPSLDAAAAAGAAAAAPADEAQAQQQQQPHHSAGSWPTTVTLPLRPTVAPAPFATHIPTGSVAVALAVAGSLDASSAAKAAALADHPAATVGKAAPGRREPRLRHSAKRAVAEAQRVEAAEAQRVIAQLRPSREAMEEFWASCRHLDREVCGKVTPTDFVHALERSKLLAGVTVPPTAAGAAAEGTEPAAATAAAVLARGLQDGSGLVSYRHLARALLTQTAPRRISSAVKAPAPVPTPASTRTPAAAGTAAAAAAKAPSDPAASGPAQAQAAQTVGTGPAATEAIGPVPVPSAAPLPSSAGAPLRPSSARPSSRQTSGGAVSGALGTSDGADGAGDAGPFGRVAATAPTAATAAATAPTAATAAATAGHRRSVVWAPEPATLGGGSADADTAPQAAPPASSHHHNQEQPAGHSHLEQQQQQQQQRLLQRQNSSGIRRAGATFTGGNKRSVTAYFNLGAVANDPNAAAVLSTVAAAAAGATAGAGAGAGAAGAALTGMGFGPNWPPFPHQDGLQKRSTITIMQSEDMELRDIRDTTYFPFKAHPHWFGGRAPMVAPGVEAPGGPAEAAREYQPSTDPLSMIVGKGHHRLNAQPTGAKLEPEVEAAIVQRLRPKYEEGASPEAMARARAAANVVQQLQQSDPLMYPGSVDPTRPPGVALKGLLGALYPGANGRPATAGTRRSAHFRSSAPAAGTGAVFRSVSARPAAAGGGGIAAAVAASAAGGGGGGRVSVGRVALERQMHREDVAAVRSLH